MPTEPDSPLWRRLATFSLAALHVVVGSGAVYGWTALRPLLRDSDPPFFPRSDDAFNVVGTFGISANALCKLPLGLVLDYAGPRVTAVLGGVMLAGGSIMMTVVDRDSVWQVAAAYFLIGVSGPFIQMPCFQFTELFGERRSVAMSTLVTCFELSTGVFWVFAQLHDSAGLNVSELFTGMAGCGGVIALTALIFWPDSSVRKGGGGAGGAGAEKPSIWQQLASVQFAYATLFLLVQIFRQGFILATVGPQTEHFFDPDEATFLSSAFSVILPLGFVPMALLTASGLAGLLLSRKHLAFFIVTCASMVYGLLLLDHRELPFLVAFALFPLVRQLVFSCFFSYVASRFGYASFGRLSGVASTATGLVQLAQAPLIGAVQRGQYGLSWTRIDLALGVLPVVLFCEPVRVLVARMRRAGLKRNASGLLQSLISDNEPGLPPMRVADQGLEEGGMAVPERAESHTKWDVYATSMGGSAGSYHTPNAFVDAATSPLMVHSLSRSSLARYGSYSRLGGVNEEEYD